MNRAFVLALMLVTAGQVGATDLPRGTERFHDDEYGVTCWTIRHPDGNAISCVPDSLLEHEAREEEEHESRPASSPASNHREERVWL